MEDKVVSILDGHGIMTIATVRPDGWPHATTVGYARDGMFLYFLISRTSQKFVNLTADNRASITVASEPPTENAIEGLSIAARASELRDEPHRSEMLARLSARHPGYFDPKTLDMSYSALMRAAPEIISIVNYALGLGHTDLITVGTDQMVSVKPARPDNWGPNPAP